MTVFSEFLLVFFFATVVCILSYAVVQKRHWSPALSRRATNVAFSILFCLYVLAFGGLAVLRHLSVSTGNDLAQYDQLIWNSLHGRLFENTFVPDAPMFLGKSFSPILLAFVPIYAVLSNPITLLVIQTLALGVAALPLYWFARARIGNLWALAIVLMYFLYTPVASLNILDFHEIVLVTPLFAFAVFFMTRHHYKGMLVCLWLALLVKEEVAFTIIVLGVYVFLVQRQHARGLAFAALGVLAGVVLLQFVIPFFHGQGAGGGAFYYFGSGEYAGGRYRYAYLGSTIGEIILTILTRPDIVLPHLLVPDKLAFVAHFLAPLGFLPLIGFEFTALALPALGYTLLSTYPYQYSILEAYTPPLIPFFFFGAIVGVERVLNRRVTSARFARAWALAVFLLLSSILSYHLHAPTLLTRHFDPTQFQLDDHRRQIREIARLIPADAVVVAQNELLSYVSQRRRIYEIPMIPDYRQADYLLADTTRQFYQAHRGFWEGFLASGYFEIISQSNGYLIAKRRAAEHRVDAHFENGIVLVGFTIPLTGTLQGGMTLRPILEWRAEKIITERYAMTVQVVDAQGHVWALQEVEPQDGKLPTIKWEMGKAIGDQFTLRLPPTMPTGEYQLVVGMRTVGAFDFVPAIDANGKPLGVEILLGNVSVQKNKGAYTASELQIEQPLFVDMREMRFLGYVPPRTMISLGELLQIGVYWRAREKPRGDYIVAVQLRDDNGRVAFEHTARPANNTYPTTEWDAGEVLLDWHAFHLPRDLALGSYQIFVVLRDVATNTRVGETLISTLSIVK